MPSSGRDYGNLEIENPGYKKLFIYLFIRLFIYLFFIIIIFFFFRSFLDKDRTVKKKQSLSGFVSDHRIFVESLETINSKFVFLYILFPSFLSSFPPPFFFFFMFLTTDLPNQI